MKTCLIVLVCIATIVCAVDDYRLENMVRLIDDLALAGMFQEADALTAKCLYKILVRRSVVEPIDTERFREAIAAPRQTYFWLCELVYYYNQIIKLSGISRDSLASNLPMRIWLEDGGWAVTYYYGH